MFSQYKRTRGFPRFRFIPGFLKENMRWTHLGVGVAWVSTVFQEYWNAVPNISTLISTSLRYCRQPPLYYMSEWEIFPDFVFHTIVICKNKQKIWNDQTRPLARNQLILGNLEEHCTAWMVHLGTEFISPVWQVTYHCEAHNTYFHIQNISLSYKSPMHHNEQKYTLFI